MAAETSSAVAIDGLLNSHLNLFFFIVREPPYYRGFAITHRHITLGSTPLDE